MSDFSVIEGDVTLVSLLGESLATTSGIGVGSSPHLDVVSRTYGRTEDTVWVPLKVGADGSLYIATTPSGINVDLGADFNDVIEVQKHNIYEMGLTPDQTEREKANLIMIGGYNAYAKDILPAGIRSYGNFTPGALRVTDAMQRNLLTSILTELKRMNIYMSMLMGEEIADACFPDEY